MAFIGLNITITGYAGDLLLVWKKNSNVLAEVGRSAALPFPVDQVYTIPDLAPVVYLVEFWRTDDGVTLNEFIKSWEIDASKGGIFSEERYTYVVGRGQSSATPGAAWADPADAALQLLDERLAGATHANAYVESRGTGKYRSDEITFLEDGGIEYYIPSSSIFSTGDTFFITVLNKTDLQPDTTSGTEYNEFKELKDDVDNTIDFDATFYKKLCYANFSGTVGTIVFPTLALIPDTKVRFDTHQGTQNYLKLQFAGSETVKFQGHNKNVIYLAKGEEIELIFSGSVCRVFYNGNAKIRGSVHADFVDKSDMGSYILANESVGVLTAADYPGLYEIVEDKLEFGAAVTLAAWATDKTRWGIDTGSQTFRVPHLANMSRRFRETSEAPGTYQADMVGPHSHKIWGQDNTAPPSGGGSPEVANVENAPADDTTPTAPAYTYRLSGVGSGTETRVKSFKEIPLIVL
jgi:hypothetical protein